MSPADIKLAIEAFLAVLKALPDIIRLILKIGMWFEKQETKALLTDLEGIIDHANETNQTPEAKRANMDRLSRLVGRLRR